MGTINRKSALLLAASAVLAGMTNSASAINTFTWDGDTSTSWSIATNWQEGVAPGGAAGYNDAIVFAAVANPAFQPTNVNVGSSYSRFYSVTFTNTLAVQDFTVGASGKSIYIGDDVLPLPSGYYGIDDQNANYRMVIANNVLVCGDQAWNVVTGGQLTVSGIINNPGIAPGPGNFGLEKVGGGTLVLTNTSSTFGGTGKTVKISAGTLSIGANANLGNTSNSVTLNGGTLKTTNDAATIDTSRALSILTNSTIDTAGVMAVNWAGTVDFGANRLTKTGQAILEFRTSSTNTSLTGSELYIASGSVSLQRSDSLGANMAVKLMGDDPAAGEANFTVRDTSAAFTLPITVGPGNAIPKRIQFATPIVGVSTISSNVTLNDSVIIRANVVGDGAFSGVLSGAGGITKNGSKVISLSGSSANTYGGLTTVEEGTLALAKSDGVNAVPGNATLTGGILRWDQNNQVADAASIAVAGGTLDLQSYNETVSSVTVTGGAISGSGTLTLSGTGTVFDDNHATGTMLSVYPNLVLNGNLSKSSTVGTMALRGNVDLGGATRVFDIASAPSTDLLVYGTVSNGGITKIGEGSILLRAANTYEGPTNIDVGMIGVYNASSFGATTSGTTVSATGCLLLLGNGVGTGVVFDPEPLILNGTAEGTGALRKGWSTANNTDTWTGPVTLATDSAIGIDDAGDGINISGTISGASMTKVGAGTLELSGTGSFGALDVQAGTLKVTGNQTVTKVNSVATLSVENGGKLTVAADGTSAAMSTVSSLSISGTGSQLDLNDNDMIVAGGDAAALTAAVAAGRGDAYSPTWDGDGVISSTAKTFYDENYVDLVSIGVVKNQDFEDQVFLPILTEFNGVSVTGTDVLVKYTYMGDADLTGEVDGSDYQLIDTGYNFGLTAMWVTGDFNYDGAIDGSDYQLIDTAYGLQLFGPLGATTAAGVVPEPASLSLVALGAMGLLARRRRN